MHLYVYYTGLINSGLYGQIVQIYGLSESVKSDFSST